MTDKEFLRELESFEEQPYKRFSPQNKGQNIALPGHCSCADTDWCPLGRSGAKVRCSANELRDALCELQKVVVYLHG